MNKRLLYYQNNPFHLPDYLDLRAIQDDKTVLRNPHKGWYWHYVDNGFGRAAYRDRTPPNDDLKDFPGLHHLYLRFDWGDIEAEEGKLDWQRVDDIIEHWGALGYRFSFRLCTYEGDGHGVLRYATPKWVYDAGAKFHACADNAIEPCYDDPIYLNKLERFMCAYGEKYNGHPLLDFIDIGTYGTWGEGHTYRGSETVCSLETAMTHINMHTRHFPATQILLNDDFIVHRQTDQAEKEMLALYAQRQGVGLRDDSLCVDDCCAKFGYDTLRAPELFDMFWPYAPVDLEFEHYHMVFPKPDNWRGGLPFVEALSRTHATYAGFHGYPRPWLEKEPSLTAYLANRLGYWYFVDGIQLSPMSCDIPSYCTFVFSNRGYAAAYRRYTFKIRLCAAAMKERILIASDVDNRRWQSGQSSFERIKLDIRGLLTGVYQLSIGLFEGNTVIALGVDVSRFDGAYYYMGDLRIV